MKNNQRHLSQDQLGAYLDQALHGDDLHLARQHLDQCQDCQKKIAVERAAIQKLENLPPLKLERDLSSIIVKRLREEQRLSPGLTWTLILEGLAAVLTIGLLIPVVQAALLLPRLLEARQQLLAAANIFLTQLASSWLVWFASLQLDIKTTFTSLLSSPGPSWTEFSPWILVLAAGSIGILVNYLLLRSSSLRISPQGKR